MKIDLNLLPLFLAVAEEHNFRSAADRLGVTRSSVSQGMTPEVSILSVRFREDGHSPVWKHGSFHEGLRPQHGTGDRIIRASNVVSVVPILTRRGSL
jgi:hypothetical protein